MNSSPSIIVIAVAAGVLLCSPPVALEGQRASLSGVVLEEGTDRLLAGVRLTVVEAQIEVLSDETGGFSFPALPPGEFQLRASLEGHVSLSEPLTVEVGETAFLQLRLASLAAALQELLVFGDRSGSEVLASDDAGHASAADLLESQLPGLSLRRNTGSAGGGASVQLRGVNSLSLSNEAVIYVEGIRISPRMGSFEERGSVELHVLEMIPAASVAGIRVLRGPAATARYPDTSNGVILVETVRGLPEN